MSAELDLAEHTLTFALIHTQCSLSNIRNVSGYTHAPGAYSDDQIASWKKIVDEGGYFGARPKLPPS